MHLYYENFNKNYSKIIKIYFPQQLRATQNEKGAAGTHILSGTMLVLPEGQDINLETAKQVSFLLLLHTANYSTLPYTHLPPSRHRTPSLPSSSFIKT